MKKNKKEKKFGLSIKASGIILNPWFQLTSNQTICQYIEPGIIENKLDLTDKFFVELPAFNLNLYFDTDSIIFINKDKSLPFNLLINPIQYFLTYKTFINYNIVSPYCIISESQFSKVDILRFKIGKIIRIDKEEKSGNKIIKTFHHEIEPHLLEFPLENLFNYLSILNKTIYFAIASYLIGCDNPRYFLVEFYKAVEFIKNSFKNEDEFINSLSEYGITKRRYKKFTQNCNDSLNSPFDIGRHAPSSNTEIYSIDIKNLFVDPLSTELFLSSTKLCRDVIDAYINYSINKNSLTMLYSGRL